MTVGVVGLGLIGGSLVKAYKRAGHKVFGFDIDKTILEFALLSNDIEKVLDKDTLCECDLILIALYPQASVDYLKENAKYFSKQSLVIDCCGTKRDICQVGQQMAKEFGFTFAGGHPMAGTHNSGYKFSTPEMFVGAPMVVVPSRFDDIELIDYIQKMLKPAGFGRIVITTADEHDKMIAFTSQMAHIVSNAFIKSPTALEHNGVSAGSYKDLTRVAWLNPKMWTELFFENRDYLIDELDVFINNLIDYKLSLQQNDKQKMTELLEEGRQRKQEVDG